MAIDVYSTFVEEFCKEVVNNEEGCTLPHNLGWIKVVAHKNHAESKHRKPEAFKDKTIFHPNHHSSGWVFRSYWYSQVLGSVEDITKTSFFNSDVYSFQPGTHFKKAIHTKIMSGEWNHFHQKSFFKAPRVQAYRGRPKKNKQEEPYDETADNFETEAGS
jgi:hypothetical protein